MLQYLVTGHHGGDQGVGTRVLVHIRSVHLGRNTKLGTVHDRENTDLLREAWLLVILVLGVDPHRGGPGPARLALVFGRYLNTVK